MTVKHGPIVEGEELEVVCGCAITFRSAVLVRSCGRAHALQTGDSVTVVNVDPGGAVLGQVKCGCRCFLFDQAVITKCPTA